MNVITKNGQLEITRTKTTVWRSGLAIVREVAHHSANGVLHTDGGLELGDEFRLERFFPGVSGKAFVDHVEEYESSRFAIDFESEGEISFCSSLVALRLESEVTSKEKDAALFLLGTIYEFEGRKLLVNEVYATPSESELWNVAVILDDVSKDETGLVSKGAFPGGEFSRFDGWNNFSYGWSKPPL